MINLNKLNGLIKSSINRKNIKVDYIGSTYKLEEGEFVCQHDNWEWQNEEEPYGFDGNNVKFDNYQVAYCDECQTDLEKNYEEERKEALNER